MRDTIQVLSAGIGFSIFLVFLSFISFQYINHNRRIISECRLLDALVKEIETASKSVDQIKQRANQVWESELNLGITHTLSKIERRWLRNAGKVGSDAKQWAEDYKTLIAETREMSYADQYVLFVRKSMRLIDIAFGIKGAKGVINSMPRKKNNANHITVLLEDWRSKVRRLQDRPIEETEHSTGVPPMLPFRPGVAFVLERLLAEKPNLVRGMGEQTRSVIMHLQLLEPFVKD